MTTAYDLLVKEKSVVFDIGAYVGERTQMFLDRGASIVLAVEPVPLYANRLKEKFSGNDEVRVLQAAAGQANGLGFMRVHHAFWPNGKPMDSALSSLSQEWIESVSDEMSWNYHAYWGEAEPVIVVTLDTMIKEYGHPDFIKIDVEGYEREVIKGLTKSVAAISYEFHSISWAKDVADYIMQLGPYEFNYDLGDRMELMAPGWLSTKDLFRLLPKNSYGDIFARRK